MHFARYVHPFLKLVHPDFLQKAPEKIRHTNHRSLQKLNDILDAVNGLSVHAKDNKMKYNTASFDSLKNLESKYDLHFFYQNPNDKSEKFQRWA